MIFVKKDMDISFVSLIDELNRGNALGKENKVLTIKHYWEIFKLIFTDLLIFNWVGFGENYKDDKYYIYEKVDVSDYKFKEYAQDAIEVGDCLIIKDGELIIGEQFINSYAVNYLLNKSLKPDKQSKSGFYAMQNSFLKKRVNPYIKQLNMDKFINFKQRMVDVLKAIGAYPTENELICIIKGAKFEYDNDFFNILFKELVLKLLKPSKSNTGKKYPDNAIALLFILSLYPTTESEHMYPLFLFLDSLDYFAEFRLGDWIKKNGKRDQDMDRSVEPPKSYINAHIQIENALPSKEIVIANVSEHEHMDTLNYEDYVPSKTLDISDLCSRWHNYYQNAGRYKGYSDVVHKINNEKSIISTSIMSNGTGEGKSLYDVVFNDGEIHNISLTAKGGYGKTFILLRFVDRIISEHKDVLPFYIPLNELDNSTSNCISEFIVSTAMDLGCEEYTQKKLEAALNDYSGTVLFLFDGLNEITDYESRKNIIKSIFSLLRWTQNRNNNIRMIITSRYDFSSSFSEISEAAFNNYKNNFFHYQVNELSDDVIKEYIALVGCDISFDTLSYEKKQLLRTPQGLHMYVCLNNKGSYTSEFKNFAELIEVYVEKNFKISTKSNYNLALCNIGYLMVKNGSFRLNNKEYKAVLDSAGIDIDKFNREVLNANLLVSVNAYCIEFSHQNYRDYFCAKCIAGELSCISIDSINELIDLLSVNDDTMSAEILCFVADLLGEYNFAEENSDPGDSVVQNALNGIAVIDIEEQKQSIRVQSAINHLIEIAKYGRNNDISGLALNNLYLVNVSLNGCKVYKNRHSGLQTTKFDKAVVSEDTFIYQGIVGIIRTVNIITDEILLIVTSKNVYLYNTSSNSCKCIYSSKEEVLLRVFGAFLFNNEKYVYVQSKYSLFVYHVSINNGDVTFDRINDIHLNEKNVICCYDNGRIFLVNDDGFIEKISLNENNKIERFLIVKSDGLANKYCVSRKYIYAAKDKKIYRAKLVPDNTDTASFDLFIDIKADNVDMCFVNYANSLFVCEEIGMMSRISQIPEISQQIVSSVEKEHTLPNDGGKIFSGFGTLISDGKRLFCGINTEIVGHNYYPISDVCEIYYDMDNRELNLLFEGHNLHNATFIAGFCSDNTLVVYSRTNSILMLNVDDETYNAKIYTPELTGVGKIVAQANNVMFLGCLDGCLQKWQKINNEWKCIDVWKLFSNDDLVSGYEPLEYNWRISTVNNKVYTCFLGREIVELCNVGNPDESIRISEKIADRILNIAAENDSDHVIIHVLAWKNNAYEYMVLDDNFTVVYENKYSSHYLPCFSALGNEIYLSTSQSKNNDCNSQISSVCNKESKEILRTSGIISSLDISCINDRKIIAFTNEEDTNIHFFFQGLKDEWIEWSHSPMQYNIDGVLGEFMPTFSGTVKILWKSISLITKGNIIRLCAEKINDIYYMEGCLIDDEIHILREDHYPAKYKIYCVELLDDCIAVGDEEGGVHFIYIGDKSLYSIDNNISTEIGVLSNYHVDLSTAVFEDQDRESSKRRLKGYFHLHN